MQYVSYTMTILIELLDGAPADLFGQSAGVIRTVLK